MGIFDLEHIRFGYGATSIIEDLSLSFEAGHFYGIIGPNGSGKTTLIDLLAGHRKPQRGEVRLNGRPLNTYDRNAIARRIALVPQDFGINFPYTCGEVVMMGRYPHIPRFARPSEEDLALVRAVLKQAALEDFTHRYVNQLSGGERQRVVFARGLAQNTPVLLLDEATSNLDMHHAIGLLNLAAARVTDKSVVIAVMQDVNLAAMYCDRLVCLRRGEVYSSGAIKDVLTSETLQEVFQVQAQIAHNAFCNTWQVAIRKDGF